MPDPEHKDASWQDGEDDVQTKDASDCRAGGNDVLTDKIRAACGVGKYESLMSGVATSTRKGIREYGMRGLGSVLQEATHHG